jgi:hypothetical protein
MCGDAEDMYPAGGVLDHRETVQPGQQHGVAMEKVAGQDPFRLRTQELTPRWTAAPWTWIDSGALEDGPDRGRADLPALYRAKSRDSACELGFWGWVRLLGGIR